MKKCFKMAALGLAAASLLSMGQDVQAGGGGSYPNGAESFLSGMVPPPGFYYLNYAYYYSADSLKDNNGDDIGAFDKITAVANVSRFLWMSESTLFGGNYGQHLFVPYLDVSLDFKVPVGPGNTMSYDDGSVPYLIYSPMVLAYHLMEDKLHVAVSAVDLYIPTGQEDGNMAATGHNFWTFEPVVAITYLPNNWEFSAKFMYDFNTTQDNYATVYGVKVDRTPGQEFHFDYSCSYALQPSLRVGLNGYYYVQTTDDNFKGIGAFPVGLQNLLRADEGMHSTVLAVGPGVWYNHQNMYFVLRTQIETMAKNKTEGQNVWFNFTYAF
jgi:hypothetical protein